MACNCMKTGTVLIGGIGVDSKAFSDAVNKRLKKYEAAQNKLFDSFYKDIERKGLQTKREQENLWETKYSKKFQNILEQSRKDHEKTQKRFFGKK